VGKLKGIERRLSLTALTALLLFFSPPLAERVPAASIDLNVLTIESLVLPLCAGTSPTFRAFIGNDGSTDSGFFNIRWNADGQLFEGGHFSIPAGVTDTHDHIWQNIPLGQYTLTFIADPDNFLPESKEKNNQVTITFTVDDCAFEDVELLAPFNNDVSFKVTQGYYNNQGKCSIKKAPDHCDNQLFGLDLVPDPQFADDRQILAPVGGIVDFLPAQSNAYCLGITLDDGIHLNLCHFENWDTLNTGDRVTRGQILGTRSTSHIHISLDDRRAGKPYIPIPFNGRHTFEAMELDPNHEGNGDVVSFRKHLFQVQFQEWQGLTAISRNSPPGS
jgi:hypothetical protein